MTEHPWGTAPDGVAELAACAGPERVAAAARVHGVTGCVHDSLAPVVAPECSAELAADRARGIDLHLRAMGDLAELAPALDARGVHWLVMKGPVLGEIYYPRPDLRIYNDVDVVVPGAALKALLAAVEEVGGHLIDRNWPLLRELEVTELLLRLRHGSLLDLHWQLFNYPAVRRESAIAVTDLLERARPVRAGGLTVPTLDPVDTLVHLCAHGTLSGGNRLVWLKDVDRVVATDAPPWDEVVSRARSWSIGPAVGLALHRARRVLGVPVPAGVPEAVAEGSAYLAAGALADRLAPPARSNGNRSIAQLVSRAARRDSAASAVEVGRRLTGVVTGLRLSLTPAGNDIDPASRRSIRYDTASAADRDAFLDAVGRGLL